MIRHSSALFHTLLVVFAGLNCVASAYGAGPSEKVLYRFKGENDGSAPRSRLIADVAGNLYGTAEYAGGGKYYGTVFELSPPKSPEGTWTETTLFSFNGGSEGGRPVGGLVFDKKGNLYGTASNQFDEPPYGNVFQLSPPATNGGAWTETVLYTFQGGTDGAYPNGDLLMDNAGNLYGTTETSVFELSPPGAEGGSWILNVLHDFTCCTTDGFSAYAGLARDSAGNLYGTTELGGYYGGICAYTGCGTVYRLSAPSGGGGAWSEEVLYRFKAGDDGFDPFTGVAIDPAGNLYGTTYSGGTLGGGTAYEVSAPVSPGGSWSETIIHNFSYSANDGAVPNGTLIADSSGNLYGTTELGGNGCFYNGAQYGCGTVFVLTPPVSQGEGWGETVLYFFTTQIIAAKLPDAGLLFDGKGSLYGTTVSGGYNTCTQDGSAGCGTVYKIVNGRQ